jgi:hypothetical protein
MTNVQPTTGCQFCSYDHLVVHELTVTHYAHLLKVVDDDGQDVPGQYFLVPTKHTERVSDLPDGWNNALGAIMHDLTVNSQVPVNVSAIRVVTDQPEHLHWLVERTVA